MELWHRFVTMPTLVQVIAWACTVGLLLCAWVKGKAIAASIKAAKDFVENKVAAWVAGKVQPHLSPASQATNQRVHRGYFINYNYVSHVPDRWSFQLEEDDGGVRSVAIQETGLLLPIRRGVYVEIRTMLPQVGCIETVQDVKVFHTKTKAL